MARRRCIVPADAYYEWSPVAGTLPHAIGRIDGEPLAFAAIWERWKSPTGAMMLTFAILTTPANDTVRPLAARMPVILEPQNWPLWLGETPGDPISLLHAPAADTLYTWTVSPDVTNPKNNGPELLDPFDAGDPSPA
jgi:putative SOS response-associated peptidase YedK